MKAGKNRQIIERYIDAVTENNPDRIMSFFAADSVFENLPGQSLVGGQAIWEVMSGYHEKAEQVAWIVDDLKELEGSAVQTSGKLAYRVHGEWIDFEINGTFEIKGSKIVHWH